MSAAASASANLIAPTAFDINTSIQCCLVKVIALHGLALCICAGEDVSQAQIHKLAVEVGVTLEMLLTYFGPRELKDIAATDFLIRSLEKRRASA